MRAAALTFAFLAFSIVGADAQQVQLNCNAGPVEQTFGGTPWVVYGCDDGRSIVVATRADNPANPFVFVVAWEPHGYRVHGEGNGDRTASASAFDELSAMNQEQITALYSSAQQAE